jgi:steroid 5-alpha reductase family enzyme
MLETTHAMATLLMVNTATAVALFAVMWWICVRVKNYGFLDVTWTLCIGLLALIDGVAGTGPVARRMMFTIVGLAWSLRLGLFVLARVLRHHPAEDKRYRTLRERWKSPAEFLAFFELQALIAVVFSAPFLLASVAGDGNMAVLEWLGLAIAAVGTLGETIADAQSEAFKRSPRSDKRILDVGLWRYSRHPNYFFEMVVWIGFALAAFAVPLGWIAILCPVLIVYFLLRVTGIPLTEKHSLETHGQAYRDYQQRTSSFIPWARKSAAP